ncbi:hypothetical protein SAMN04488514_1108 [Kriegella aquimaris]|uniref:Uncharacterized protein n=1 Tax=Kriegella aquimaris TaxID=192904 RepID=A0A1G9TVK9_9FLAO|nr:hypothetical protein SAMN04488514_1108 [Kriegella aquimaris]
MVKVKAYPLQSQRHINNVFTYSMKKAVFKIYVVPIVVSDKSC